jgi:hypothetical protein
LEFRLQAANLYQKPDRKGGPPTQHALPYGRASDTPAA